MDAVYHAEGRAVPQGEGFLQNYTIRDHLGNTRVVFFSYIDPNNSEELVVIAQAYEYYPFGLFFNAGAEGLPYYPYTYNHKEWNGDYGLDWYDYGARWYDAAVGRWWVVDALADDAMQVDKSPYAYGWNNPVKLTDPDGNCPWCVGAIVGAITDYGMQVASNLVEGKSIGESLTDVDSKSILTSVAMGALGGGLLAKAGKALKGLTKADDAVNAVDDVAKATDDVVERAKTIQNAQSNAVARNKSTTSVAKVTNPDGSKSTLVASSRKTLTSAQRKALKAGETEVKGKGHAEKTIVEHTKKTGQKIEELAASRPVCQNCAKAVNDAGGKIVSPLKKQ